MSKRGKKIVPLVGKEIWITLLSKGGEPITEEMHKALTKTMKSGEPVAMRFGDEVMHFYITNLTMQGI